MRNRNPLTGGIVLVVLGVLFLLSNHGLLPSLGSLLDTWWPLFLIVPGLLILARRWRSPRN